MSDERRGSWSGYDPMPGVTEYESYLAANIFVDEASERGVFVFSWLPLNMLDLFYWQNSPYWLLS